MCFLQIIFSLCVIATMICLKTASLSCHRVILIWEQSWWSNYKTIIKLCYCKISWFVGVPQISICLSRCWSARHWQITVFCSTSIIQWVLRIFTPPRCDISQTQGVPGVKGLPVPIYQSGGRELCQPCQERVSQLFLQNGCILIWFLSSQF